MIKKVTSQNPGGNILELDLRNSGRDVGLLVFTIDGLGPPKATVNGTGGPNFDGIRASSVRADARHLLMTLAVTKGGELEEDAKQRIYTYFPVKKTIIFGIETDRKDVYIPAVVESNEFNQFATVENAVISLLCPNPYFVDRVLRSIVISDEDGVPNFECPFSNESLTEPLIEFGFTTDLPTAEISYSGEVQTGMDLTLNFLDVAQDIIITNNNGDQTMTIDTSDLEPLEDGDQIFINTRVGEKSIWFVRDTVFTNIINAVGIDDDWINLRPGGNRVIVDANSGLSNIETEIQFRALSEGV
jgi:hypothetical protein